jgi:hypothetical protein
MVCMPFVFTTASSPQMKLRLVKERNPPSPLISSGYGGGADNVACQMPSSSISLFNLLITWTFATLLAAELLGPPD